MDAILSLSMAPQHAQRLLLSATIGTALLLLAACGSDAPAASDADIAADATSVAQANTDDSGNTVASTGDSQTGAPDPDGSSAANTVTSTEQYLADAHALLNAITATSDSVAAQLENADVESALWRTTTADALRELAAVLDSASDLAAPSEYASRHQALIDATSKYSWATEMLADGVETLDLNTISDAAALLANASLELATAQAELAS